MHKKNYYAAGERKHTGRNILACINIINAKKQTAVGAM